METSPVTCRTLETFYHINGHLFEKQYKESLSGFREWEQSEHAEEWLLFADNIGPRLEIDETSLSNGELYTFVTNRDAHTREQCLVVICSLNLQTIGHNGKKREHLYCLMNTQISSRHMDYAIPCE